MPAVLVTGAATGIGAATAKALRAKGFRVYGGQHTTEVPAGTADHVVALDVTDDASVRAAAAEVGERERGGLHAVVNNAGVIVNGPIELVPADEWARGLAVNVTGPALVTAAFLPQLRAGRGRVVNVSAPGGSVSVPFSGAASASKAALDAITDALRLELEPFGIPVVTVVPAIIDTEIFTKSAIAAMTALAAAPPEVLALYQDRLVTLATAMGKQTKHPAEEAAATIVTAVTATRPRTRYVTHREVRALDAIALLPTPARDRALKKVLGL